MTSSPGMWKMVRSTMEAESVVPAFFSRVCELLWSMAPRRRDDDGVLSSEKPECCRPRLEETRQVIHGEMWHKS